MVDHGTNGPLHLSYADPWEKGVAEVFIAAEETGMEVCKDNKLSRCLLRTYLLTGPSVNNGNPIGKSIHPRKNSYFGHLRSGVLSSRVLRAESSRIIISTPKFYHSRQY